jgi:hypothetical protein
MKDVETLSPRIMPLLAVLSLVVIIIAGWDLSPIAVVQVSPRTIVIYLGSIAFAYFSLASLIIAATSFSYRMNRAARIYSILVALACFGFTWYLAYWGMIPLRTWAL